MPLLPSLDEQLRAARDASGETFMWAHIDTCLSCYLHDHHHRDGELLLGAIVFGDTTIGDVLDELQSEFNAVGWDLANERRGYDHEAAQAALDRLRAENADRLERPFDSSLDLANEDEELDDYCQAWFLLTWDVPDEEDDASD